MSAIIIDADQELIPRDIAALVLFPPDFDEARKDPAIISLHPPDSCKEQSASNAHGAAHAREGFVIIAFDASFRGESGGTPRFVEDPPRRVEDIGHVIDHAVTPPDADAGT